MDDVSRSTQIFVKNNLCGIIALTVFYRCFKDFPANEYFRMFIHRVKK